MNCHVYQTSLLTSEKAQGQIPADAFLPAAV